MGSSWVRVGAELGSWVVGQAAGLAVQGILRYRLKRLLLVSVKVVETGHKVTYCANH